MQSNGGVAHRASRARERPLQTLLSGPVGGTMGLVALAAHRSAVRTSSASTWAARASTSASSSTGKPDVADRDRARGPPAADADRRTSTRSAPAAARSPTPRPAGCASGRRAPAPIPGPACYGRGGTRPTVTDANLVLGRIDPETFAGGRMALDIDAARARGRAASRDELGLGVAAPGRGDRLDVDQREDGAGDPHAHGRAGDRAARLRPRRLRRRRPDARGVPRPGARDRRGDRPAARRARSRPGGCSRRSSATTSAGRSSAAPRDADLDGARRDLRADRGRGHATALDAEGVPADAAAASSTRSTCATRRRSTRSRSRSTAPDAPSEPGFVDDDGRGASTRRTTPATGTRTRARRSSSWRSARPRSATSATPSRRSSPAGDGAPPSRTRDVVFDGLASTPTAVVARDELGAGAAARGPAHRRGGHRDHRRPAGLRRSPVDRYGSLVDRDRKGGLSGGHQHRRRPDHHRGDPQRAQLRRRRDERDADPLRLHADHLRAQGLLGRAARRRATACSASRPGCRSSSATSRSARA